MIDLQINTRRKEREMYRASVELARDSARAGQRVARGIAREDTGRMKRETVVVDTRDGAELQSNVPWAIYNEFGTGLYAESGRGRKTPWVYFHPRYGFVTTEGMTPRPFMRPAMAAGIQFFNTEKHRRGMG